MRRSVFASSLFLLLSLVTGCQKPARPSPGQTGVIEGTLRLSGPGPVLPPLATSPSVASVCGTQVPDRSLVVGAKGALAYVVVALADGTDAPPEEPDAPSAVLDQKGCSFEPPVIAARAGSLLEVRNEDPLLHNVNALSGSHRPVLNVALPLAGSRVRRPLPTAPGILQLHCDLHPWMSATVRTFEHPWFTTTDAQGHFRLEVPPGTHSLILWHPRLPGVTRTLTVPEGQTVHVDHTWAASEVRDPPSQDAPTP